MARAISTAAALLALLLAAPLITAHKHHGNHSGSVVPDASDADVHAAVCARLCAPVCAGGDASAKCAASCVPRCAAAKAANANATVRPGKLSPWITFTGAIQHVGLTTSDLNRSVAFYTDVMGGVEVIGAGGDGWNGDDVYQLLMQAALVRGGAAAGWAANISAGGPDTMAARYVAFDSVVIELLDYHSKEAVLQRALAAHTDGAAFPRGPAAARAAEANAAAKAAAETKTKFPRFSPSTVAALAGNMHISFNVRPTKDLNAFVTALEATAHAAGFADVYCNRLVPVKAGPDGHPDVDGVPAKDNSYAVVGGAFGGWSLAYCKGPDGEQLEFNQVVRAAKQDFDQALRVYLSGGKNPIW